MDALWRVRVEPQDEHPVNMDPSPPQLSDRCLHFLNGDVFLHLFQGLCVDRLESNVEREAARFHHQVQELGVLRDVRAHLRCPFETELSRDHFPQEILRARPVENEIVVIEEWRSSSRIVMRKLLDHALPAACPGALSEHLRDGAERAIERASPGGLHGQERPDNSLGHSFPLPRVEQRKIRKGQGVQIPDGRRRHGEAARLAAQPAPA